MVDKGVEGEGAHELIDFLVGLIGVDSGPNSGQFLV
jgi:hypothetical protein